MTVTIRRRRPIAGPAPNEPRGQQDGADEQQSRHGGRAEQKCVRGGERQVDAGADSPAAVATWRQPGPAGRMRR
jgi:hypothetical protein